jgi:hypothetical protein
MRRLNLAVFKVNGTFLRQYHGDFMYSPTKALTVCIISRLNASRGTAVLATGEMVVAQADKAFSSQSS